MHDARAVSNFILDRAEQAGLQLTPLGLLKVLYFAHAWHLAKYDKPLVGQPFEAWTNGPVSRVVYDQLKHLRGNPITEKLKSFDPVRCEYADARYTFDSETTRFLMNIFDYYSQFRAVELSEMTHERGSPWDVVWTAAEKRAVPGMIIPDELIKTWFRERASSTREKIKGNA